MLAEQMINEAVDDPILGYDVTTIDNELSGKRKMDYGKGQKYWYKKYSYYYDQAKKYKKRAKSKSRSRSSKSKGGIPPIVLIGGAGLAAWWFLGRKKRRR